MKPVPVFLYFLFCLSGFIGPLTDVSAETAIDRQKPIWMTSLDTGLGSVDEDLFFLLHVRQGLFIRDFSMILSAPLRFRILDRRPYDERVLREQDWDDPSDWARIVPMIRYQRDRNDAVVAVHLGEQNGFHMGHGSIISHYYNSTDTDYYQAGLSFLMDIRGHGFAFWMHNVVQPGIFGGRIHTAPVSLFSEGPLSRRLEIGAQLMVDTGVSGQVLTNTSRSVVVAGGDIGFRFVDLSRLRMDVVTDILASGGSGGIHSGVVSEIVIVEPERLILHLMAEYRYMGTAYYPALVNPFYDNNRRTFSIDPVTGQHNTFAEHRKNPSMEKTAAHGFMIDVALAAGDRFRFGARYDYQGSGRPHWLLMRLEMSPMERFSLRGFFAGQDIEGGMLFSSEAMMGLSVHIGIKGPLRAYSELVRRYRRVGTGPAAMANEISGGIGLLLSY